MGLTSQIFGSIRQAARRLYTSGGVQSVDMNLGGDLIASQGLPERSEIVRMGLSFSAQIPAGSAWTLLITIPTTLSNLALQNPNTTSSKVCYVIDRFWVKNVTSEASAGELTPLSQLVPPGTALAAATSGIVVNNLSGSSNSSSAQITLATTATGCITDRWNHHASRGQSETTNIATCVEVQCYGRYIVRPQASFNINAQESVSGGTAICGVEWHEVVLDLG